MNFLFSYIILPCTNSFCFQLLLRLGHNNKIMTFYCTHLLKNNFHLFFFQFPLSVYDKTLVTFIALCTLIGMPIFISCL